MTFSVHLTFSVLYAKTLLLSGDLPISKVAELSGFGDSAYFCREFKKSVGVSPSEYTY